jgi:ABC-type sugar transport system permease subunit
VKRRLRDVPWALAMLLPSLGLLLVWTVYPLVRAVQKGHLRCDVTGQKCTDLGWGRYTSVFQSNEFQHALLVSVKLMLLTVPTGLVLGIALAVLADKHLRGIGVFRTIFSAPSPPALPSPAWCGSCCCSRRSVCSPTSSAGGSRC